MPDVPLRVERESCADRTGIHHHGVVDQKSARTTLMGSILFFSKLFRAMTAQHTDLHTPPLAAVYRGKPCPFQTGMQNSTRADLFLFD